jgi:hypothetical protein
MADLPTIPKPLKWCALAIWAVCVFSMQAAYRDHNKPNFVWFASVTAVMLGLLSVFLHNEPDYENRLRGIRLFFASNCLLALFCTADLAYSAWQNAKLF